MCWNFYAHDKGFLSTQQTPEHLPFVLFDHERVVRNLFSFAESGILRKEVAALPNVNIRFYPEEKFPNTEMSCTNINVSLFSPEEREAAFSLFAILASAYVNCPSKGEGEAEVGPVYLTDSISKPLCLLAKHLERQPIWDYAGSVLGNYKILDTTKPISLDNIKILRSLTGLESETWFYKIHVVIEAYGGVALEEIVKIRKLVKKCYKNFDKYQSEIENFNGLIYIIDVVVVSLELIAAAIQLMKLTFSEMSKHCKDKDFYLVVRPWLKGWQPPGVVYQGISNEPVIHGGGSGAQSSLLPALDAFFGVSYMTKNDNSSSNDDTEVDPHLVEFVKNLKRFRTHMPREHIAFLSELEGEPSFRNFFAFCNELAKSYFPSKIDPEAPIYVHYQGNGAPVGALPSGQRSYEELVSLPLFLKERQRMEVARLQNRVVDMKVAYNYAIENMLSFRRMHVGYATSYITRQARKAAAATCSNQEDRHLIEKNAEKGTGGSSFAKHFMSHIKDTRKCLFRVDGRPRNEYDVDAEMIRNIDESQQYKRFESLRDQVMKVRELRHTADIEKANQSDED